MSIIQFPEDNDFFSEIDQLRRENESLCEQRILLEDRENKTANPTS
jgi:hypothetical protein